MDNFPKQDEVLFQLITIFIDMQRAMHVQIQNHKSLSGVDPALYWRHVAICNTIMKNTRRLRFGRGRAIYFLDGGVSQGEGLGRCKVERISNLAASYAIPSSSLIRALHKTSTT